MRLQVAEGSALVATIAAVSIVDAVTELLLGEGDKLSSPDLVLTLEGTSGGESPASTTLTLILDSGHGTLGNPVDVAVDLGLVVDDGLNGVVTREVNVSTEDLLFSPRPVREVVVSQGEVLLEGVAGLNLFIGLSEVFKSLNELLNSLVHLAMRRQVVHELNLDVADGRDGTSGES